MAFPAPRSESVSLQLAGEWLVPLCEGGLWWPRERLLIVSDLHLEKGSALAAGGQMLPPYDTLSTLSCVESLCQRLSPRMVISLGDSFHDQQAEHRLSADAIVRIRRLTSQHDWIWVEGNHDPVPPQHLGGRASTVFRQGPLVFRHEPEREQGEIAGHFHPVAKIRGRGRSVRRKCFASNGDYLVMPSLGAYTGGLNVCDPAFQAIFPDGLMAFVLGSDRVFALNEKALLPDVAKRSVWRLKSSADS